jgi:hypothetical protein
MTTATTHLTAATAPVRSGASPLAVFRLHYAKRSMMFGVPLYILLGVLAFSAIISLVFWRAGSEIGSDDWIQGSRSNQGMVWAFIGFMVYMGVQSVATTFPLGLSLGSTRRSFTLGTLLSHIALAAYLAAITAVVFLIEIATNHWFVGFYLTDVYILGAGDLGLLLAIQFLTVLTSLSVGAAFAAVWVRFGNRGTTVMSLGLGIVLAATLVILVPYIPRIAESFELWWLAVAAVVIIALSALAEYACLRRASVR